MALGRPVAIALVESRLQVGQHVVIHHPGGELDVEVTDLPFVR
jgi:glycine cleavage system aminomethyltransferase T